MSLVLSIFHTFPAWLIEIIQGVWEVVRVIIGIEIVCGISALFKKLKSQKNK